MVDEVWMEELGRVEEGSNYLNCLCLKENSNVIPMNNPVIWQYMVPCWKYFLFSASQNLQWSAGSFNFILMPHVRTVVVNLKSGGVQILSYTWCLCEMSHLVWLERSIAGGCGFCREEILLLYCLKRWRWEATLEVWHIRKVFKYMVVKKKDSSCVKSKIVEMQLENEVGFGKCVFINLSVIIALYLVIMLFYLVRELWKRGSLGREVEERRALNYIY